MDVLKARCGCGAIVSLPSLKARAQSCDACARKRSAALNEARDTTPAWARMNDLQRIPDGEIADDWHALNAQLPFGPVDKWEQRARELGKGVETVYLPSGTPMQVYPAPGVTLPSHYMTLWTTDGFEFRAKLPMTNETMLKLEQGQLLAEKPAKRPFAVGDRVVVKRVANHYVWDRRDAAVLHVYDGVAVVKMEHAHSFADLPGEFVAGSTWSVAFKDLEHA